MTYLQATFSNTVGEGLTLHSERLGPLPLINHFIERIGVDDTLARHVPSDPRCALTHASALGVLLRSIIVEREAVYRQQETVYGFANGMFGVAAQDMEHLSDDRLGRALDHLYDADRTALLTELVLAVGQRFDVRFEEFHNDSTTISFCGSLLPCHRAQDPRTHGPRDHLRALQAASARLEAAAVHPHHECRRQRASGFSLRGWQRQRFTHAHRDLEHAQGGGWTCGLPLRG
jgi:hypothetical protein